MITEEIQVKNRFSGALWANKIKSKSALIGGIGATGSYLALFLARAGVNNMRLVDPDHFETHNLGSQMVSYNKIGSNKASSIKEMLLDYTDIDYIYSNNYKIQEVNISNFTNDIICATLDTMEGRKYMFEKFLDNGYGIYNNIFFDSRIGAEYWEVYCVPRNNEDKIKRYKETLFEEDQGNTGACNYQQSSHSACGAALKIVELVTNWVTNEVTEEPDDLPFKVTNDIRNCLYGVHY